MSYIASQRQHISVMTNQREHNISCRDFYMLLLYFPITEYTFNLDLIQLKPQFIDYYFIDNAIKLL